MLNYRNMDISEFYESSDEIEYNNVNNNNNNVNDNDIIFPDNSS